MREINRLTLIGLGAMGSKYALKLDPIFESGKFQIVADGDRKKRIDKGMYINGTRYSFNTITPEQDTEPADLIMFVTKTYDLPQAIEDVRKHVGENTILMSLSNGIESEEMLAEAYGKEKVIYAKSAGLGALRNGNEIIYRGMGYILFGELSNMEHSERVQAIEALFKKAQIDYDIPLNMQRELWWKFMVNVGCNQVSTVIGANYWDYQNIPEIFEATENVMREVIAVANKAGIDLNENDILRWHNKVLGYDPADKTSMLQDIERGRQTEVETYSGKIIRLGRKLGVPTPLNQMIYLHIRALESKNMFRWRSSGINDDF